MNKEVLTSPVLEALLQAPSLAILALDKQGCVILWSPSAARMFGWTESEVLGRFVPTVPEEHRQVVYDRIQSGLKGEIISALDVRRLRKDGSLVDVSLWTAPLRDSRGEVIGILGIYADITARKQAEEALQESEQRFRSVFSEAAVPTALTLPDGRYLQVNHAYCELLGYSEGELLATTFDAVTHFEDRATMARDPAQRLFAGELNKAYQTEKRYLHKLGHVVWGALSVSVVRDTAGAPRYFIGQVQDITERKRAEAELREREQRFRAMIEHSFDVICVHKADGTIESVSASVTRVLGYRPDELVGRNAFERVHPEDLPRMTDVFDLLVQTPDGTVVEQFRCGHKDGSWRWIEISGTNCLAQPEVGGIVINFHDITLRKQAEEVLRESEERYRLMAEAIPQPVWRTNAQGETVECNSRWYEYTGQTPEEARGNGWMKALHPDDVGRVMQKVQDDVAGGELYEAEYRVRRASDGSYRWHLARALPIKDKDGRILCWFGGAVDIDDQKRAHEVLEERVRERTAELMKANETLRQSEARYRTLVEQIPAITYIAALDEASTTLYVSPQVGPLLGLTPADFQANAHTIWLEHLHPDDRERVTAELQRTHTSAEPFDCEYRMLKRTGGIVWFRDRAVVVRDEAGHPIFLHGVMLDVTERKRADEALREFETRFRTVFDGAADGMFVFDLESRKFVICNAACSRMLGFTPDELRNLDTADLHLPEDLPFISEQIGKFAKGEEGARHDIRFKRRDGSTFFTDLNPTLITLGGRKSILIVFRDITERKQAEESRRHLAAIVESSDDAIVSADLDETITSWNAGAQRLYNYAPEEIVGRPVSVLVPRNRRGEIREFRKKLQCGKHIYHYETVRLRKGGFPVDVSITVSPMKNDAGQVIGLSAITREITERKRAAEALQKSEEQYRALVETTDTGFVILDRAGRVLDGNAEYVRLTGHRDLDEIRGRSVVEWTAGPKKEMNAEAVRRCLKTGHIRNLEIGYVDSHGKVIPVEVNATVEKTRGILRIVSLCRDITERKKLEQAILDVTSREQERIGRDLHDGICQRLTGIAFLWKVVADKVAARALPEAAEVAEIGQLITKTISDARDLARGLCPVELENNDLGLALKNLGSSMERLFPVSCTARCQRPVIVTDKVAAIQLYRVAQEAINNAVRHGKAKHVRIDLAWRRNKLTLRVKDDGSGFSKRKAFTQGMGMRIMQHRAHIIGAMLTVESTHGAGTTVTCVYTGPSSRSVGDARRLHPETD